LNAGPLSARERQARLVALAAELRPQLHRYCARLMGSVIEGEDVVQDTLLRAIVALQDLEELPPLPPWLFRVAHNRAMDLLRRRAVRAADPLDEAPDVADTDRSDPLEALVHKQAVRTAVSRFVDLPVTQRSVVVLKDVLDESLADIASLPDLSVDAVKAHLARGRTRLRELNALTTPLVEARPPSAAVANYVRLFNERNWDALRALLADDFKLSQSTHSMRVGRNEVGMFFTIYAQSLAVRLAPGWLEGKEAVAVFEGHGQTAPSDVMWLQWDGDRIGFIRDYRYVR
jgi:RNA polymerase sigma factor (sigma-70 family)